ncbi:MAG: hypothetical protein ACO2O5_00560 [Candidatus Caldipriscus sp.]
MRSTLIAKGGNITGGGHPLISEEIRDVELGEKEVYTADGRYVGKSVPNRRGIYFVISGNKRRKVIVR